jgi:hypothetical protein
VESNIVPFTWPNSAVTVKSSKPLVRYKESGLPEAVFRHLVGVLVVRSGWTRRVDDKCCYTMKHT